MGSNLQNTLSTSSLYTITMIQGRHGSMINVINDFKHTMEDRGNSDPMLKHAFN